METASPEVARELRQPGLTVPGSARITPLPPNLITWPLFKQTCGTLASLTLTGLLFAMAFLPLVTFLAAGVWAAATFLHELVGIGGRFGAGNFSAVISSLDTMDVAGRVGFFCASYFMLLFSLVVLFTGLLGRRRQHLYLIPGITLTCLSVLGFVVAARFLFASLHAVPLATDTARRLFVSYIALDAVALGALLADLGPPRRARRRRVRERQQALVLAHTTVAQDDVTAKIVPVLTPAPEVTAPAPAAVEAEPAAAEAQSDTASAGQTTDDLVPAPAQVEAPVDPAPAFA